MDPLATSLPLSAWTRAKQPIHGLEVEHAVLGSMVVTGGSFDGHTRSARCEKPLHAERWIPEEELSVSLLTRQMALRAYALLRLHSPWGHLWLHPDTSTLEKEQIAEALVAAWTLESRPIGPRLAGVLRIEPDGRILTVGDMGGRARYSLSVQEVSWPKGSEHPYAHEATLSRGIGPYGDLVSINRFIGTSVDEVRLYVEANLGAAGYLFLHDDGHIRLGREIPRPVPSVPF